MPCTTRNQKKQQDARLATQPLPERPLAFSDSELAHLTLEEQQAAIEQRIRTFLEDIIPVGDLSQTVCAIKKHKLGKGWKMSTDIESIGCWYVYCTAHQGPCYVNAPVDLESHPQGRLLTHWLEIREELNRPSNPPGGSDSPTSTTFATPSTAIATPAPRVPIVMWTKDSAMRGRLALLNGPFISLNDFKTALGAVAFEVANPLEIYSLEDPVGLEGVLNEPMA
ncbi:hypothetical protein BDN72DRAFT_862173 [Pluteus cervinus]|uniref:Uncharacterized protein n=1 Tax=Pluteus cervinus TaxID=181527 RepID=A0ACD3AC66_9AGAR|nr:hypothetical protein BDN72DRAFT_862173 [Pluteus cervinus]